MRGTCLIQVVGTELIRLTPDTIPSPKRRARIGNPVVPRIARALRYVAGFSDRDRVIGTQTIAAVVGPG